MTINYEMDAELQSMKDLDENIRKICPKISLVEVTFFEATIGTSLYTLHKRVEELDDLVTKLQFRLENASSSSKEKVQEALDQILYTYGLIKAQIDIVENTHDFLKNHLKERQEQETT